jgi:caa(3)-type oxidase subunit IV
VALLIATIKGSMVAMFFMHLNHERRIIYWVLMLTVVFFFVLMLVPLSTTLDRIAQRY